MSNAITAYCSQRGSDYHDRNRDRLQKQAIQRRVAIRNLIVPFLDAPGHTHRSWLEVGCGEGYNLFSGDVGVDIDPRPLLCLQPDKIPVIAASNALPFPSSSFTVVFCVGLLMHQTAEEYRYSLNELARVSSSFVLIGEYVSEVEAPKFDPHWPNLLYQRPYPPPDGWHFLVGYSHVYPFDADVTFMLYSKRAPEQLEQDRQMTRKRAYPILLQEA